MNRPLPLHVYVINGDSAYARFALSLIKILGQVFKIVQRSDKKSPSRHESITPALIGYRLVSDDDANVDELEDDTASEDELSDDARLDEKDIKLSLFNNNTTFHFFLCAPADRWNEQWGSGRQITYDRIVPFLMQLQSDHKHLFSQDTLSRAEALDVYRNDGKKGLKLLGLSNPRIKQLIKAIQIQFE